MGSAEEHSRLLSEILLAIGSRTDCRVWRNETGMAFRDDHAIRYGKRGSSDILGLTSDGRMLCIEVKTGKASQSKHQVNFQKSIEKFGGRYLIARSIDYVVKFLDDLSLPKITI
jgi:hypothetical protein